MSIAPLARLLERVGSQGEGLLAYLGGLGYLALDTLKFTVLGVAVRPRIKTNETFFQMVRLGVRAIPIVVLVQTFERGENLRVQSAPPLVQEIAVRHVVGEGVAEGVRGLGEQRLLLEELGLA